MGRTVRIVTDSTADIPTAVAAELDVTVVPLSVHFGDESYRDGVDLTAGAFYDRLRQSKELPRTSQPSPALFDAAFRTLLDHGHDVVSIHISSALSGTFNAATLAAQALPTDRIRVVDSKLVTLPQWLTVRHATRAALRGAGLEEVATRAVDMSRRTNLFAMMDTLDYLQRGGRIGGLAAFLGSLLSVKPLLSLRDGQVVPVERIRTRTKALDRLVRLVAEQQPFDGPVAVGHGNDEAGAEYVRSSLVAAIPGVELLMGEIGPVVGTHAGPGAVGAAFTRQR